MPAKASSNLAARMGRWSANHWKTATFGWLAFVLVAFALGGMIGTTSIDSSKPGPGQSGRMDRILDAGFERPAGETVLVQSRSAHAGTPAFDAAIADVTARVSRVAVVQNVHRGATSKDGHSALVDFQIRGPKDKAADKIGPVLTAVSESQRVHPAFFIGEFGDASAEKGVTTAYSHDLAKAGTLSLPVTLIILVLTFGALVAAGIPLLLALTAVFATFGLIAIPSSLLPVANEAPAMVLLIGLAVGVDYSMFYLTRVRQERAAGRGSRAAIEVAAATSGRSVLVSGLTVIAAMAGMFLTGDQTFASLGLATILVVAVAVVGSLTVLPALLSRLGDNVDRLRVPFTGRPGHRDGQGRVWGGIVDRVLRRPLLSAVVATGVLLALAAPALQLHIAPQGPESFPKSLPVMKAYNRMQQAFPGSALPANVVVKAPNVDAPAVRRAIRRLEQGALASGRMYEPITIDVNRAHTVADITVPIAGRGTDAASNEALHVLRDRLVPHTVGALPTVQAGVTGLTAEWNDQASELKSNLLPVIAFVLLLAFALMLLAFRSLVVAAKTIVLNLLSVGAAYGVLVLVFQHGIGKGLIGAGSADGIETVVPLLLFVILFGLSMDYHVFILSRIRETFDRGATMDEAVSQGIKSTAGVVTSAATVMVFVFSIFATLSMPFFKQFGIGLAAAILIDATIVRAVLLPATMKLLGNWNWYLPRWLEWLPQLQTGEIAPEPEPEPEPQVRPRPSRRPKRRRGLTAARITGLLLVTLVAIGLAYLRFAPGAQAVSVPKGAHAGQLIFEPCKYETEKGSYKADCGTLVVRENRADPHSRLIALPVTRIRARSQHPLAPIFRLEGGPGISNMSFAKASRFSDRHDVVLVGYRGVDGSVKLDCPEVESALSHSTDFLARKSLAAYTAAFHACASRLTNAGIDVRQYGLVQQVDDLEAARRALGYGPVDLLSESAGTRTALIYAWRYPRSVHRSVMIGVNPPGHFLWDTKTFDEQIGRYTALCAHDTGCSRRTHDLAATLKKAAGAVPRRFWFLPVKRGNVLVASMFGLFETTADATPLTAPMTIDTWLSAAEDDPSGLWFLSLAADLGYPHAFVWGQYAAAGSIDDAAVRAYFTGPRDRTSPADAATSFVWGGGGLAHAWPAAADVSRYRRVRPSNVPMLLVGGALDFSTPPQNATRQLLPYLPNGHQVVLPGIGHSTSFWTQQPRAGTHLVETYFDSGRVDTSPYRPQRVDFTPDVAHTALAKGIAGTMIGLAALTILSLLLMARRIRRRDHFGRKAGVLLRSLYPIVLGLGGWFLGALIVLAAMPGVPLDDELLAAPAVGLPVGVGIYYAWVRRDWTGQAKAAGFAAAVAAALLGAWLGLHAAAGMLALPTAIVGAIAAANLILLLHDIASDREHRDVYAEAATTELRQARATVPEPQRVA